MDAWTGFRGTRKDPVDGGHMVYGFLPCEPNGVVGPIHPKGMPVCLTAAEECDVSMRAP